MPIKGYVNIGEINSSVVWSPSLEGLTHIFVDSTAVAGAGLALVVRIRMRYLRTKQYLVLAPSHHELDVGTDKAGLFVR